MKGIYILKIVLTKSQRIEIGKLGQINFQEGYYYYIGSAQNNLQKRLERHMSNSKKIHWHIDYLLSNKKAKIEEIYYKNAEKEQECLTAQDLTNKGHPIKNFGSSDCKCNSHLMYSKTSIKLPEGFKKV